VRLASGWNFPWMG